MYGYGTPFGLMGSGYSLTGQPVTSGVPGAAMAGATSAPGAPPQQAGAITPAPQQAGVTGGAPGIGRVSNPWALSAMGPAAAYAQAPRMNMSGPTTPQYGSPQAPPQGGMPGAPPAQGAPPQGSPQGSSPQGGGALPWFLKSAGQGLQQAGGAAQAIPGVGSALNGGAQAGAAGLSWLSNLAALL